ncbi:hypothetical protein PMAYCL1PPCAC_08789 [Pristionchus mayeri]|uniref:Uncharacterized protein n=1 Tax=Pristionchus mayeri TaxID=1317129 RepID=A0AAN4ZFL7_9BILA|nr:hypothetical protein PMAYCL1PPCAC_08789 [Pristionchus mayeri]
MNSRERSDRQRLVEPESESAESSSTSTQKELNTSFAPSSTPSHRREEQTPSHREKQQQEEQLGADEVQQAHQLQLQHPQQPLKKCEFCRKPVLPQKEQPSCARSEGVVHSGCADSERRYEEKRKESERASNQSRAVEEQHECIICQSSAYRRKEDATGVVLREDTRWIKPCFCEVYAHHGCLAGVVEARRSCPQCGERYTYRVYGSLLDFLSRYWLSYCFIASIVAFFCLIAVYSMVHVFVYPVATWPSGRIVLLIVGLFLTCVAMCFLGSCLRYTFGFRVPRFKGKYAYVSVFNYTPPLSRETTKRSKTTSLLMTQIPRKASDKGRSLLSFSIPSDDSMVVLHSGDFQRTSTPKYEGAPAPFDFNTPSFRGAPPAHKHSFRRLEEHPLRLTLERVPEMPEEDSISYDGTMTRSNDVKEPRA